jgi:hypothetical protein
MRANAGITFALVLAAATSVRVMPANAQDAGRTCAPLTSDSERLACYDAIFRVPQSTSPLHSACEDALKSQLKAPSTYKLANVAESRLAIPLDEYKDTELLRIRDGYDADTAVEMRGVLNERIEAMKENGLEPVRFTLQIEYDAQNAFGAMIRGVAVCTYVSGDGKPDGATASNVSAVLL